MSLSPLLPVVASVVPALARQAAERLPDGLSFLDHLRREEEPGVEANRKPCDTEMAKLAELLRERLAAAGVDTSTPLRLKQGSEDNIIVDGDHPDRVVVEGLFAHDPQLRELFHRLADTASNQRASRAGRGAQEFRLVLDQTGAEIEFE